MKQMGKDVYNTFLKVTNQHLQDILECTPPPSERLAKFFPSVADLLVYEAFDHLYFKKFILFLLLQ